MQGRFHYFFLLKNSLLHFGTKFQICEGSFRKTFQTVKKTNSEPKPQICRAVLTKGKTQKKSQILSFRVPDLKFVKMQVSELQDFDFPSLIVTVCDMSFNFLIVGHLNDTLHVLVLRRT